MRYIVGFAVATVLGLVIGLAIYLGAWKSVHLSIAEEGPFKLLSKRHIGAYHKILPVIQEVEKFARANGEACRVSFGEYLQDPNVVDEDRLQSNGGCVIEKELKGLPNEMSFRETPRRLYVVAEFDGAPSIGPYKVYPKAMEYIDEQRLVFEGPVTELYEVLSAEKLKTRFLFPVRRR